jgi:hypothetical protein
MHQRLFDIGGVCVRICFHNTLGPHYWNLCASGGLGKCSTKGLKDLVSSTPQLRMAMLLHFA